MKVTLGLPSSKNLRKASVSLNLYLLSELKEKRRRTEDTVSPVLGPSIRRLCFSEGMFGLAGLHILSAEFKT